MIFFIYRDEVYNEDSPDKGIAEIIIGKQRNGPIGTVKLTFLGQHTRFENYSGGPGLRAVIASIGHVPPDPRHHLASRRFATTTRVAKRAAPRSKVFAVVKANAYGHGLRARRARAGASADGFAMVELEGAVATARARLPRARSCCWKASSRPRELPSIARAGPRRGGPQRGAAAHARGSRSSRKPDRRLLQDQHGHEPPGLRSPRCRARSSSACSAARRRRRSR